MKRLYCLIAFLAVLFVGGLAYGAGVTDKSIGGLIDIVEEMATTEMWVGGGAGNVPVKTTVTGTGAPVLAISPTLVTPLLGTPTSGTLTNCTGLPISTGVSGLGANVGTWLATPSSANFISALTDETGTGAAVFANTPTLVTPVIGAATGTSLDLSGALSVDGNVGFDGGTFVFNESGADLDFRVESDTVANALFVEGSSGNVGIGTTSPAKDLDVSGEIRASTGILFGTDTAAANTLDDYEEGTYTATLTCGTSGTITLDGDYSELSYTKIGRMMTITGEIRVSSVSSPVGTLALNLPTSIAPMDDLSENFTGLVVYYDVYAMNEAAPAFVFGSYGSSCFIRQASTTGYFYDLADNIKAETRLVLTFSYCSQ